jgi:hypothetical protein
MMGDRDDYMEGLTDEIYSTAHYDEGKYDDVYGSDFVGGNIWIVIYFMSWFAFFVALIIIQSSCRCS